MKFLKKIMSTINISKARNSLFIFIDLILFQFCYPISIVFLFQQFTIFINRHNCLNNNISIYSNRYKSSYWFFFLFLCFTRGSASINFINRNFISHFELLILRFFFFGAFLVWHWIRLKAKDEI